MALSTRARALALLAALSFLVAGCGTPHRRRCRGRARMRPPRRHVPDRSLARPPHAGLRQPGRLDRRAVVSGGGLCARGTPPALRGIRRLYPIVVLVNRETTGGAELLAPALQHHGRAIVLGEQTPGRTLIRRSIRLSDGSTLRLATAEWFLPGGPSLRDRGVTPDLLVDEDPSMGASPIDLDTRPDSIARDRQLQRALARLRE